MGAPKGKIIIAGGGLAGLTLAWFLAEAGLDVLVIESKDYPRQRVCGEYLSLESLPILERIGVKIPDNSPFISKLQIFVPGKSVPAQGYVPLGAIGVSRYFLDDAMYRSCLKAGVHFQLNTRVLSSGKEGEGYQVKTQHNSLIASLFINATGKAPSLHNQSPKNKSRYVAAKFHLQDTGSDPAITLYQFPGGYCGTSMVEDGLRCVCYLVRQELVEQYKNLTSVEALMIQANKALGQFLNTEREQLRRVVISNFYFGDSGVENGVGDSRYLIPPLTGNGMSLAIRDGYKKSLEVLGKGTNVFKANPAAELIQMVSESPQFKRLHSLLRMKPVLGQIVESTFGPII